MSRTRCVSSFFVVAACLATSSALCGAPTSLIPSASPVADGFSVVYEPSSGRVIVTAPEDNPMTAVELRSESGAFAGTCQNLGNAFDVCTTEKLFKLDTVGLAQVDFGEVLPEGMSGEALLADLMVDGASKGGGFMTGQGVFLVHGDFVPEPLTSRLFAGGALLLGLAMRSKLRQIQGG